MVKLTDEEQQRIVETKKWKKYFESNIKGTGHQFLKGYYIDTLYDVRLFNGTDEYTTWFNNLKDEYEKDKLKPKRFCQLCLLKEVNCDRYDRMIGGCNVCTYYKTSLLKI